MVSIGPLIIPRNGIREILGRNDIVLCLPDNRRYLFLFRAGQLTPVSCGFPRLFCLSF